MRGTFWILAHGRTEAFDQEDLDMMHVLSSFAAELSDSLQLLQLLVDASFETAGPRRPN
jgi:hypothetical protein